MPLLGIYCMGLGHLKTSFWGVVAVFAGGLADHFGNVRVVLAGTLFYALGMVMMATIVHWPIEEQPVLWLAVQDTRK